MVLVSKFLEAMRRRIHTQKTMASLEYTNGHLFKNICCGLNILWSQHGVDPSFSLRIRQNP